MRSVEFCHLIQSIESSIHHIVILFRTENECRMKATSEKRRRGKKVNVI